MTEVAVVNSVYNFNDVDDMVDGFLTGKEGTFAKYVVGSNAIYVGDTMLAKRGVNDAVFIAPSNSIDQDVNDTLLTKLITGQYAWKRVPNFEKLLNGLDRQKDFRDGNFDKINLIAGAYGIEVDLSGYELYDKRRDLLETRKKAEEEVTDKYAAMMAEVAERFDSEQNKLNTALYESEARIMETFQAALKAEKEQKAKIADQLLSVKVRELNARWDAGEPLSNMVYTDRGHVKGAGGKFYRLRKIMYRQKPYVESTGGERTTVTRIMQAFNLAAPIIFGGRNEGNKAAWDAINGRREYFTAGSAGSYNVNIYKDNVSLGCQSVSHAELERFGLLMGWPVDGTPATA